MHARNETLSERSKQSQSWGNVVHCSPAGLGFLRVGPNNYATCKIVKNCRVDSPFFKACLHPPSIMHARSVYYITPLSPSQRAPKKLQMQSGHKGTHMMMHTPAHAPSCSCTSTQSLSPPPPASTSPNLHECPCSASKHCMQPPSVHGSN